MEVCPTNGTLVYEDSQTAQAVMDFATQDIRAGHRMVIAAQSSVYANLLRRCALSAAAADPNIKLFHNLDSVVKLENRELAVEGTNLLIGTINVLCTGIDASSYDTMYFLASPKNKREALQLAARIVRVNPRNTPAPDLRWRVFLDARSDNTLFDRRETMEWLVNHGLRDFTGHVDVIPFN